MDKYSLINGDCFEKMKEIPDNSIDLILTDPPYNISQYSTGNMQFGWRSDINNDIAEWDKTEIKPSDLLKEFKRILSPMGNIFIFCTYNLLGEYHKCFDPEFESFQFLVWHKTNPIPNFRKSSFLNSCELVVCCWNKGHIWNFAKQNEMHNFIENPVCMGKERIKGKDGKNLHPAQKPVKVLEKIISVASNENSVVLDCFNGVASTGEAALSLGRRYIGIEIDPVYYKASVERLKLYNKTNIERQGAENGKI